MSRKTDTELQNEIKLNQAKQTLMRMKEDIQQSIIQLIEKEYRNYEQIVEDKNKQQQKGNNNKGPDPFEYLKKQTDPLKNKMKTVQDKINENRKLAPQEKQHHLPTINNMFNLLNQTQNFMSIKANDKFFKQKLDKTTQHTNELISQLDILNGAGCCGAGGPKKGIEYQINQLQILYENFWQTLIQMKLNAREGIEYLPFNFNIGHIKQIIKQNLQDLSIVTVDKIEIEKVTEIKNVQGPVQVKEEIKQVQVVKEVEVVKYKNIIKKESDIVKEAYELLYGLGRPQHVSQGIKLLEEEADKEEIGAINTLGKVYQEGKLVNQDLDKAYEYYTRSMQKESPEGFYRIGQMYENGDINKLRVVQSNQQQRVSDQQLYVLAIDHYQQAAQLSIDQQNEHLDVITDLGYIYEHGYPAEESDSNKQYIKKDLHKAKEYYEIAKDKNFPRALNNLGRLYQNMGQKNTAFLLFQRAVACQGGYARASYNLGVCYQKGYGVQIDNKQARYHFKKAYEKGDIYGKLSYAYFLLSEASETDDEYQYREVYKMLRQVLQEDPNMGEAYYYLGYMYENGFGVSPCEKTALDYYEQSNQLKFPKAINKMGEIFEYGQFEVPQNDQEALHYYNRATQLNEDNAMVNLGRIEEDKQTEQSFKQAYKWYKKAAQLGNHRAQTHISELYRQGKGVEKDEELALEYLQIGAKKDGNARYILEQIIQSNIQQQQDEQQQDHVSTAQHSAQQLQQQSNIKYDNKPQIKYVESIFPTVTQA